MKEEAEKGVEREPLANSGLAGALKVASQKGYIEKDIKKSVNVDQKHKERIRNRVFYYINNIFRIYCHTNLFVLNIIIQLNSFSTKKKLILVLIFSAVKNGLSLQFFILLLIRNPNKCFILFDRRQEPSRPFR